MMQKWKIVMLWSIFLVCLSTYAEGPVKEHGLVGLRPLPRTKARDHHSNHGGSWAGTPTFAEQQGQYPFVAEHLDVVTGWLAGDFQTKRVFFEYYWGLSRQRDVLDPEKNLLIKTIRQWKSKGGEVVHILICREYDLAINRGHTDAEPGPFKEGTRILYEKDYDNIRARQFMNDWSKGGPAHHCAIGTGHIAAKIEKLAELLGIEYVRVC